MLTFGASFQRAYAYVEDASEYKSYFQKQYNWYENMLTQYCR